jgi:hypothetical protein
MRAVALIVAASVSGLATVELHAQNRGATPARGRGAAPAAPTVEPAVIECPSTLGTGVTTMLIFCDVVTGNNADTGIIVRLPPHTGELILRFDLHNRHTYSEDLIKQGRAYRHYTAGIGVFDMDNFLMSRFAVQSEFRTARDLVDRIAGGAEPGGVKAVAPTGTESIEITVPQAADAVSIVGEKLTVVRPDSATPDNFTVAGRPIAVISNVTVEYRPAAARRPASRGR